MKRILIDASLLPVDSTVGEVEVGISNLLAMKELLTKVVSRTMEININQHDLYKQILTIQTNTHDRYSDKKYTLHVFLLSVVTGCDVNCFPTVEIFCSRFEFAKIK